MRTSTPRLARAAVVGALAAVLLLATAPGASAAQRSFTDGRGDPGADITRVTVRWADGLTVTVRHAKRVADGDTFSAYVDTRPGRKGPEYRAFARPNSDVLGLRRIDSWGDQGTVVRCRGLRARADTFSDDPVRFFVPGKCLGDPDGPVRVTARSERGSSGDWAPSARRLGPAVARR